jgi:hypothetical protein
MSLNFCLYYYESYSLISPLSSSWFKENGQKTSFSKTLMLKDSIVCFLVVKEPSSDGLGPKDGVFGVLNNIITLYTEMKMAEIVDLITRHIFNGLRIGDPEVRIFNSTIGKPTTPTTDTQPDFERRFDSILANKEWTWEKILARAQSSCGSLKEISTSDIEQHPEKVAQHYQVINRQLNKILTISYSFLLCLQIRIRTLAYKISKRQLSKLKEGRFEFFPEQQFVQYMLPSFVHFFVSLIMDTSKSRTVRQKCMCFVDKIISSYEQHEYFQVLTKRKKVQIQNRDARHGSSENPSLIGDMLCKYLADEDAINEIVPVVKRFLKLYTPESKFFQNNKNPMEKRNSWFLQMDMFALRIMWTLSDLVNSNILAHPYMLSSFATGAFNIMEKQTATIINLLSDSLRKSQKNVKVLKHGDAARENKREFVPKQLFKSAQQLSCKQMVALYMFLHFGNLDSPQISQWKHQLQGPAFPFDLSSICVWSAANDDKWKIKQIVSPLLIAGGWKGKQFKDPSIVSLDGLKSNKCYKPVLERISPDGTKVLMKQPGEITFVPLKHCRWCGLIKVQKFRLCSLCIECPDYSDINYFCSEKCEAEALDSKHREEHARYYMVKLGLDEQVY